jgi:hypothetical protein
MRNHASSAVDSLPHCAARNAAGDGGEKKSILCGKMVRTPIGNKRTKGRDNL